MIEYFLLIVTMIITLASQAYINSTYKKLRKVKAKKDISGADVARKILDNNGLESIKIMEVSGTLTDHYDPRNKTVRLSSDIYSNNSISSIAVAAHEVGHALQDKDGYLFLRFRNSIIPLVNFASRLGYIVIMIGIFTSLLKLLWVGVFLELIILLFQLITLPVEFNASSRALQELMKLNIVEEKEYASCRKMLRSAALTYVASVASSILEILRLVLIATRRD